MRSALLTAASLLLASSAFAASLPHPSSGFSPQGEYIQQVDGSGNTVNPVATTQKTVETAATGSTAIWTPVTGNTFRLLAYQVIVTADAAISGGGTQLIVSFKDGTTALPTAQELFVPTTTVTTVMGAYNSGWIPLGNGLLSAAANNALNVTLSATLTSGKVRVNVIGVEGLTP